MDNNYNVLDKYRNWTLELIKTDVELNTLGYAVLMNNLCGDFNIATVIRNTNALGGEALYYIGQKKIDRRGTVGTHTYTPVNYLESMEQIMALKGKYTFVALECGVESVELSRFTWPRNPLIVVGGEVDGVSPDLLALCDYTVSIKQYGSVRSMNVGVASGIAMNDFVTKLHAVPAV